MGARAGEVVGAGNLGIEMDAALESARRRRAARAVFGLGFGGQDNDEQYDAPPVQVEDKQSNLEVKSRSPDRPIPGNVDSTPSPSRRAAAKPAIPTPPREPSVETVERLPPSELKQATNHHHNNRLSNRTPAPAPAEEGDGGGRKQEMDPVGKDAGNIAGDGCRRPGQAQQQQHESVSKAVPKTVPLQAEQKGSSDDDGGDGGGDGSGARGKQEEDSAAGHRCFPSNIPSEIDVDVGDGGGDGEVRSKVDLRVADGWFEKFEAKMGAIKKQVRVFCCRSAFVGLVGE